MPIKRPLIVRMTEATNKLDQLKLEQAIQDLKDKKAARTPRRRPARRG